jgi:hypothetical protein
MADSLGGPGTDDDNESPRDLERDDTPPDPGLAVGFSGEDLDDVSPPVFHDGALPVGFELDSPLPHLGIGDGGGDGPNVAPLFEFGDVSDSHHDPSDLVHGHDPGHDDPGDDHDGGFELHF